MNRRAVILALTAVAASFLTATAALANEDAASGPQRFAFSGKTIRGKDLPITVSATGAISGTGTVSIIEHPKTSNATFHFTHGNIQLLFVHGPTNAHLDAAKCRATIDASGVYTIRGGTRRYAGATGKGTYTETRLLLGRLSPAGKCLNGPNTTPEKVTAVATMRGTISLP